VKPSTKAMKIAQRINLAKNYKAKAKLVHQWHKAVIEMLKADK
jgi:hypothetical protein